MEEILPYKQLLQEIHPRDIRYSDLIRTTEWMTKREEVKNRDGHKCSKCGKNSTMSHFDEITWKNFHFWVCDEKEVLVKRANGKYVKEIIPELKGADKQYYLNVHHKYYVLNRLPWDYNNDALITLCNWCHWELHENEAIDVYEEDGETESDMHACSRCSGAGWFPQYSHVQSGICFDCGGSGYDEPLIVINP